MNKKLKITFMPGAFDNFEGSQEELDALINEIEKAAKSGDLFQNSTQVDLEELEIEDPELAKQLRESLDDIEHNFDSKRKGKLN